MDPIIRRREDNLFFVHNCFGSFFKGVLDWFDDEVYPKFNTKVIGTYDKAVQYFKAKKDANKETEVKMTPCITLDPMYDFSNEERGGRFLWQFSRYAPGIGMRAFQSIDLKEQDVLINPVFSRYQGTFEIIMWLDSVYELMDLRVAILQLCGGYGRWLRPEFFWTYMIFPERTENFENEEGVKLDWGNTFAEFIHVDSTNQHRLALPIGLDAMWKLDALSDATTKFGGDRISEYKMSATFTYEVNLPTYMVLSNKVDPKLKLSFSLGNAYTRYPLASPHKILSSIVSKADDKSGVDRIISKKFSTYKVVDADTERTESITTFKKSCLRYPLIGMNWNHISNGKLVVLNDENISDPNFQITNADIVYMDSYQDSYLPYIRRCSAAISWKDSRISKFYSKCLLLNKPMICFIDEEEATLIKTYEGENITLDSFRRKLYKGLLNGEIVTEDEEVAFEILQEIKLVHPDLYDEAVKNFVGLENTMPYHYAEETISNLPNRLISDDTDGIVTVFPLGYKLDSVGAESLKIYIDDDYVNKEDYQILNFETILFNVAPPKGSKVYMGGELLIIKDSNLVAIYEFTETDEKLEFIELDVPKPLLSMDDIVLVSYSGRLCQDKDYTINLEEQSIRIYLKAKQGEIVQFFYYQVSN